MSARIINLAEERKRRTRNRDRELIEAWAALWAASMFWFWGV